MHQKTASLLFCFGSLQQVGKPYWTNDLPTDADKRRFLQGTVLNMAELHRGYSGAWLAEHRRRPLALRVL